MKAKGTLHASAQNVMSQTTAARVATPARLLLPPKNAWLSCGANARKSAKSYLRLKSVKKCDSLRNARVDLKHEQ
jgi:hypothetical protein